MAVDDIAVALVQALDGERKLYRIAADFSEKFDAPVEEIAEDVRTFVQELSVRRMLEIVQ